MKLHKDDLRFQLFHRHRGVPFGSRQNRSFSHGALYGLALFVVRNRDISDFGGGDFGEMFSVVAVRDCQSLLHPYNVARLSLPRPG